jgi:hypothetical protein
MGDASLSEDDPPLRACGAVLNRRPMRDERAETQQMADGRSDHRLRAQRAGSERQICAFTDRYA